MSFTWNFPYQINELNGTKYSRMNKVKFVEDILSISLQILKRLSYTDFTWSILEYFVPNVDFKLILETWKQFCELDTNRITSL